MDVYWGFHRRGEFPIKDTCGRTFLAPDIGVMVQRLSVCHPSVLPDSSPSAQPRFEPWLFFCFRDFQLFRVWFRSRLIIRGVLQNVVCDEGQTKVCIRLVFRLQNRVVYNIRWGDTIDVGVLQSGIVLGPGSRSAFDRLVHAVSDT